MPAKKLDASRAATKSPRATVKLNSRTKRGTPSQTKAVTPKTVRRGGAATSNNRVVGMLLAGVGVVLAFALFANNNSGGVTPSPSGKPLLENGGLWQSAVQVAWQIEKPDGTLSYCTGGSGGLVNEIDQVLTNEHVINDSELEDDCADANLYVGYPVEPTGVYFVWWPATVRGSNEFLDLALLDVEMNAAAVTDDNEYPASIVLQHDWPVYALATEVPMLGDPISIYSYPGIGGYSMTFTAGHVAGWSWDYWTREEAKTFSTEEWLAGYNADADGYREYMKLDVAIAHGSSGSSILNAKGEIVGVTTLLGVNYKGDAVDCIQFVDTNEDGNVDEEDACVPVGGFLNASATLTDIRAFLAKQGVTP